MSDILLDKIIQNTKEFLNKQAFYSFCYRYPQEWLKLIVTSIMGEKKYKDFTNNGVNDYKIENNYQLIELNDKLSFFVPKAQINYGFETQIELIELKAINEIDNELKLKITIFNHQNLKQEFEHLINIKIYKQPGKVSLFVPVENNNSYNQWGHYGRRNNENFEDDKDWVIDQNQKLLDSYSLREITELVLTNPNYQITDFNNKEKIFQLLNSDQIGKYETTRNLTRGDFINPITKIKKEKDLSLIVEDVLIRNPQIIDVICFITRDDIKSNPIHIYITGFKNADSQLKWKTLEDHIEYFKTNSIPNFANEKFPLNFRHDKKAELINHASDFKHTSSFNGLFVDQNSYQLEFNSNFKSFQYKCNFYQGSYGYRDDSLWNYVNRNNLEDDYYDDNFAVKLVCLIEDGTNDQAGEIKVLFNFSLIDSPEISSNQIITISGFQPKF